MKEPRDEFLEQIKSTLLGHEEPYDEGAWERFATKNIKKIETEKSTPVIPIWKWTAAAAAALIGAILLLQYFNAPDTVTNLNGEKSSIVKTDTNNQILKDHQSTPQDTINTGIVTGAEITHPNINNEQKHIPTPLNNNVFNQHETRAGNDRNQIAVTPAPAQPLIAQTQQSVLQKPQTQPAESKPASKPFWENSIEKNIANNPVIQNNNQNSVAVNNQSAPRGDNNTKGGKWLFSLYVSPNFSNEGINMGYGYSLGYAISNKVRVSSGIAYTKVSTSKDFDAPSPPTTLAMDATIGINSFAARGAGAAGATGAEGPAVSANAIATPGTPYIQSVDSWISGIDVPLEITYTVNRKVYATGGVSGLFVMNGQNTNKVVSDLNSRAPVLSNKGDVKGYSSLAEESKPEYQVSKNDNTSFLGFYNVSMGYKQKISAKNSVSVEPFIKVPMKQVSEQKLNYTGVGVRLKFDF